MGYAYMFDIHSGKTVYRARVAQETVFVTTCQESTGAVFGMIWLSSLLVAYICLELNLCLLTWHLETLLRLLVSLLLLVRLFTHTSNHGVLSADPSSTWSGSTASSVLLHSFGEW